MTLSGEAHLGDVPTYACITGFTAHFLPSTTETAATSQMYAKQA